MEQLDDPSTYPLGSITPTYESLMGVNQHVNDHPEIKTITPPMSIFIENLTKAHLDLFKQACINLFSTKVLKLLFNQNTQEDTELFLTEYIHTDSPQSLVDLLYLISKIHRLPELDTLFETAVRDSKFDCAIQLLLVNPKLDLDTLLKGYGPKEKDLLVEALIKFALQCPDRDFAISQLNKSLDKENNLGKYIHTTSSRWRSTAQNVTKIQNAITQLGGKVDDDYSDSYHLAEYWASFTVSELPNSHLRGAIAICGSSAPLLRYSLDKYRDSVMISLKFICFDDESYEKANYPEMVIEHINTIADDKDLNWEDKEEQLNEFLYPFTPGFEYLKKHSSNTLTQIYNLMTNNNMTPKYVDKNMSFDTFNVFNVNERFAITCLHHAYGMIAEPKYLQKSLHNLNEFNRSLCDDISQSNFSYESLDSTQSFYIEAILSGKTIESVLKIHPIQHALDCKNYPALMDLIFLSPNSEYTSASNKKESIFEQMCSAKAEIISELLKLIDSEAKSDPNDIISFINTLMKPDTPGALVRLIHTQTGFFNKNEAWAVTQLKNKLHTLEQLSSNEMSHEY